MKKLAMILISTLCFSTAYAQQRFEERVYIYSTGDVTSEGAQAACEEGLAHIASKWGIVDNNANLSARAKLFSVETRAHNGKLKNERVQEIGSILVCQDWLTYQPGTNLTPVYYEINIGGRTYRAEGAMENPTVFSQTLPGGGQVHSPPGFLPPQVYFADFSATVLPAIPGKRGGVMTANIVLDAAEDPSDDFVNKGIHVLRVYVPVED